MTDTERKWPKYMPLLAAVAGASAKNLMRVRFRGAEYVMAPDALEHGNGFIATPEQYEHGECSYAHLFPDGSVMRFGRRIGSRSDLEPVS